ncbi:MAG TPA: T9SS type A sorting domain-containing protein [Rhodothermales bacterium]|nr:T9SS type A sorting domain-containing protein [Rhodothermales bacterium]
MRISTTPWRWLVVLLAIAGFAGTAHAQRTVTLRLNTATAPDTLRTTDEVQVRGAVAGQGPFTLPDGNVIDWNDNTTLKPSNAGGDYWDISFQIPDDQELKYKFYAQLLEDDGVGGWEDGGDHAVAAGTGDIVLPLHYYENGEDKAYDWSPFASKEDSIGVLFRVFMATEFAIGQAGYDRENENQIVGLRGDPLNGQGPLDWGVTKMTLSPESDQFGRPDYHLYSGIAYYPESAAGTTQPYKFFVEPSGWEGSADRTFTVPANDTTLHWVYFSNSTPSTAAPSESAVIFSVDLTPLEEIGVFDRTRGDTLQVRGEFNGWNCENPDLCLLFRQPGEPVYEQLIPVTSFPETVLRYKFFLEINDVAFMEEFGVDVVPSGWEEPLSTTGADRSFEFTGDPRGFQDLGIQRFNDIQPGNILPEGSAVEVDFAVDMTPALDAAEPFDPATHQVTIQVEDPIWLFTQGLLQEEQFRPIPDAVLLTDPDGDMVFEGTLTVTGPTYAALQYKYAYGTDNSWNLEAGGTTAGLGRRRTRFVAANTDGSWPSTWDFPQETFQPTGNLPFESNPAAVGVEEVDGEIPTRISLSQNYPNPFNPATTFEYTVNELQHITIGIYDVTGRLVETLVEGVQLAATYRVTFDGSNLASGIYFYQLKSADRVLTRKMTLIK